MQHTTELTMLSCAIALGIVQLVISASFSVTGRGLAYGVGPRDEHPAPLGRMAARFERAFRNFIETFAFFAAAVLVVSVLGKSTPNSAIGSQIYLWARVLYVPAYITGVPFVRTICWTASMIGIVMVLTACW